MKQLHHVFSMLQVSCRLPGRLFVPDPFDFILQLPIPPPRVHDLLHLPLVFSVNYYWWGWLVYLPWEGVVAGWFNF